jgi:acyl-CoA synthetase (AMP-forming)/AMP-acid ligase II
MGVPIEQALPLLMGNDDPPVKLLAIPLFHATGCYGQMVRGINDGSKVVLMRRWDIPDAVKLMVEHKVNIIGGVPSIPTAILQSGLLPKDFQLRGLSYGGAAPQKRLAGDLAQRWPTALA